jgi:hypothetical protein
MSRLRTLSLLALLGAAAPDAQTCAGEPSVIYDVAASTAGGGGSTACLGAALAFPNAARDRATVVTRGSGVAPPGSWRHRLARRSRRPRNPDVSPKTQRLTPHITPSSSVRGELEFDAALTAATCTGPRGLETVRRRRSLLPGASGASPRAPLVRRPCGYTLVGVVARSRRAIL